MPVNNRGARKHVDRARKEIWTSSVHSLSINSTGYDKCSWHCGSGPLRPPTGPHWWRKARPAWITQLATFIFYSFPNSEATLLQSSFWPDLAQGPLLLWSLRWPLVCPSLSSLSLFHMPLITYREALNYTGWQRTRPPPLASSPAANEPKVPSSQKPPCFIFSLYFILNR